MERATFQKLLEARSQVRKNIAQETAISEDHEKTIGATNAWLYYGKRGIGRRPYEKEFYGFLKEDGCKTFSEWVKQRSEVLGRRCNVMDIMGLGDFIDDSTSIENMFAVTLTDPDQQTSIQKGCCSDNTVFIFGDIYSEETKKMLRKKMNEHGVPAIDLIVVRPFAPFYTDTGIVHSDDSKKENRRDAHWAFYYKQLQRLYHFLSKEEGTFIY